MHNYNDKKILILGAGHIGLAIGEKIIRKNPKEIIVFNRTMEKAVLSRKKLKKINPDIPVNILYGNVFRPFNIMDKKTLESVDYYNLRRFYSYDKIQKYKETALYNICKNSNPDIIIDCINMSTVLGSNFNIFEKKQYKENEEEYLSMKIIPVLITYVESLKKCFDDFKVDKYIKISTTSLAGMGVNMPYTHGDNKRDLLSDNLWGKVASTGILHQFLWNLSQTPSYDVRVIVPATCVGWGEIIDDKHNYSKEVSKEWVSDDNIESVIMAGENKCYSLQEVALMTAVGQMESISKEEVADVVVENIDGKSTGDLLFMMNQALLKSSYLGRKKRDDILSTMAHKKNAIVTGNLGDKVTKDLCIVYSVLLNYHGNISKICEEDVEICGKKIYCNILNNKNHLNTLQNMQFNIILYDSDLNIKLTNHYIPKVLDIDLRYDNIIVYIEKIKRCCKDLYIENLNNIDILTGEIVASIYNNELKRR